MKTNNRQWGKWLTIGLLTFLILLTIMSWAGNARQLVGSDFQESEQYYYSVQHDLLSGLPANLVDPVTKEELMEKYVVTDNEIEEYRFRYGDLQSQIDSTRSQYESFDGEELSEELAAERDQKIEDIRRNFEDDEYVSAKLVKEWERLVDSYLEQAKIRRSEFNIQYPGIGYSLTNQATGETFDKGTTLTNAYEVQYTRDGQWLLGNRLNEYVEGAYEIRDEIGPLEANYTGTVYIPRSYIGYALDAYETSKLIFWIVTIAGLLSTILLFVLWKRWKQDLLNSSTIMHLNGLSTELVAVMVGALFAIIYLSVSEITRTLIIADYLDDMTIFYSFIMIFFVTLLLQGVTSIVLTIDDYSYQNSALKRVIENMKGLFLNRSLAWQVIVILVIVFFWGLGTSLTGVIGGLILLWIPATVLIGIPALYFLFSRIAYLNRTMVRTSLLTEGVATEPFEVKGRSRLAEHAKELNVIREQLIASQSSQVKSERLKSELITNVSHDLRTPLTSIITYTDLLKSPDLTDEQRKQYVDVLERKSARLKTLIEDLFDVSKMASGNIELHKTQVDLASLLQQAIAEQQESLDKQNLDLRVSIGAQPIHAYVDGQKMWRVMDNLLINIGKYSMPGTRVYISLQEIGHEAVLTLKNVSQYELGDDTSELTERFKRGDQSRHTEGSGLGLAIAQSIVELHHGQFSLELDGDLFKVTMRVPKGAQL